MLEPDSVLSDPTSIELRRPHECGADAADLRRKTVREPAAALSKHKFLDCAMGPPCLVPLICIADALKAREVEVEPYPGASGDRSI